MAADKGHWVVQAETGELNEEVDGVPVNFTKAVAFTSADRRRVYDNGTPRGCAELRWLDLATQDGKDGRSQRLALAAMRRRSGKPSRFKDMDELAAFFSNLAGQAYPASLPKVPAGKIQPRGRSPLGQEAFLAAPDTPLDAGDWFESRLRFSVGLAVSR